MFERLDLLSSFTGHVKGNTMNHTKGTRAAAVAVTLLAAGLVAAGPANAAETHAAARITTQQLHAGILKAAAAESPDAVLSTGPAGVATA
jgi:hypothetical protein